MRKYVEIIDRLKADKIAPDELGWLMKLAAEAIEYLSDKVDKQERELAELAWENAKLPHWIDASKQKPEKGRCIVCLKSMVIPSRKYINFGSYDGDAWCEEDGIFPERIAIDRVTHWMRLPGFPEEVKDGKA